MKAILFLYKYILHTLKARNTHGHGIHSPYLYSFTQSVIYDENPFYIFSSIEKVRDKLKKDNRWIKITDFGTGNKTERKVADIAKTSLKRKTWGQLLLRIVNFSGAKNVLEFGTSLGISTAYLALSNSEIKCVTLEGSPEIANIARENFEVLNCKNIEIVEGNIDETLSEALSKFKQLDVVFFDANHRKEATLKYFNQCLPLIHDHSIFVFDDIHWSGEMEEAWRTIRKNANVRSTIDLFEVGIVFFNKNLPKRNYKMKR